MSAGSVIEARGLVQTFHTGKGKNKKEVHAVKGVDLDVAEGEVVGFLGPTRERRSSSPRTTSTRPTRWPTGGSGATCCSCWCRR
jgi:ABC-2 type transport system ATP-binding protein